MTSRLPFLTPLLVVSLTLAGCKPPTAGQEPPAPPTPPPDVLTLLDRAKAAHDKGDYDRALGDYGEAIRVAPTTALRVEAMTAAALSGRAAVWEAKGEYDKAVADYGEAIRLQPTSGYFVQRAAVWRRKRQYANALADYEAAVRLSPTDGLPLNSRGMLWREMREYDKALADYDAAVALNPNDDIAHLGRGLISEDRGDYARALEGYDAAIRLNPKGPAAWHRRARLRATCPDGRYRDGGKAVEDATRACELSGWKNPQALATLAAAHAEGGQFDEAVRWQKKALETSGEAGKQDPDGLRALESYEAKKRLRPGPR